MVKRNRSNNRFLLPYNRFYQVVQPTGKLTATNMGIPLNRPVRPHAVELRYAHSEPMGVRFKIYAGNGEEIYQSPALVAGAAPQVFRVTLPANTDFAMYSADQTIMDFAGTATWAIRLIMSHKENVA